MKEIIINVPEDAVELVERIGGTIHSKNKRKLTSNAKATRPKALEFFGT